MSFLRRLPWWLWAILGITLLFIGWTIWLVVSSNMLQAELRHFASYLTKTHRLQDTLRKLGKVDEERQQAGNGQLDQKARQLAEKADALLEELLAEAEPEIRVYLEKAKDTLAERRQDELPDARYSIAAEEEIGNVVTYLRSQRLTPISIALARAWAQLYFVAIIACILASISAILAVVYRDTLVRLQTASAEIHALRKLIPICAWCHKVRDDAGFWNSVEEYLKAHTDLRFTHGICPDCRDKHFADVPNTEAPV